MEEFGDKKEVRGEKKAGRSHLSAGLFAAGIAVGVAAGFFAALFFHRPAPERWKSLSARGGSGSSFAFEQRVEYRRRLEKLRYDLLAGPDAPSFEALFPEEKIKELVRLDQKKEEILASRCGVEISREMINKEIARMKEDYENPPLLLKIGQALDLNPNAVVEFWVKPVLVNRYFLACVSADPEINKNARERAEAMRKTAQTGNPLPLAGEKKTINLGREELGPEEKKALAAALPGEPTRVFESISDFHFYLVRARSGDTVSADLYRVPKPDPEKWLRENY